MMRADDYSDLEMVANEMETVFRYRGMTVEKKRHSRETGRFGWTVRSGDRVTFDIDLGQAADQIITEIKPSVDIGNSEVALPGRSIAESPATIADWVEINLVEIEGMSVTFKEVASRVQEMTERSGMVVELYDQVLRSNGMTTVAYQSEPDEGRSSIINVFSDGHYVGIAARIADMASGTILWESESIVSDSIASLLNGVTTLSGKMVSIKPENSSPEDVYDRLIAGEDMGNVVPLVIGERNVRK